MIEPDAEYKYFMSKPFILPRFSFRTQGKNTRVNTPVNIPKSCVNIFTILKYRRKNKMFYVYKNLRDPTLAFRSSTQNPELFLRFLFFRSLTRDSELIINQEQGK